VALSFADIGFEKECWNKMCLTEFWW